MSLGENSLSERFGKLSKADKFWGIALLLGSLVGLVWLKADKKQTRLEYRARMQLIQLDLALALHQAGHQNYPQGLPEIVLSQSDAEAVPLAELQRDPWGSTFVYQAQGVDYQLFSKGPDGKASTSDDLYSPKGAR